EKSQYQAAVRQAEAALAQARAKNNNASSQRERARVLFESNSIAKATYDDAVAASLAEQANVAAAQAALVTARLNLQYTEVASPIDGRVGLVTYNIGETIGPSSGTIVQVIAPDPMYVYFSVSDRQLQELRSRYSDLMNDVSLDISFASGFTYPEKGKINFIDNAVSGSTDSIRIRGVIGNPTGVLTSGQTMTVGVTSNVEQSVVTVPQAAIINDIGNKYVLAIEEGGIAQRRNIVTGTILASGRQVVTQGLTIGDTIIVDGIQKATVGQPVTPLTQEQYNAMIQQQMAPKE
ncbi:MAG: efflux RND transporter periplasmic adaptor subunit, partial [Deferribacteraceae bacterium]|nr:efflux RND transporter periplasmic adaptor subunit [Deferribacteraceae bacterium]